MNITQFTMEEVRCFAGRQQLEIRPLTFLVGENSTGKTTALACFQVLADFLNSGEVDFNPSPYSMGIFKEIVRRSRKACKTFSLGFAFEDNDGTVGLTAKFAEKEGGFEPFIRSAAVQFDDREIVFDYKDSPSGEREPVRYQDEGRKFRITMDSSFVRNFSPLQLLNSLASRGMEDQPEAKRNLISFLEKRLPRHRILPGRVINELSVLSSAPVRSQPKRTYDPIREYGDPEGSDVPMGLMRTKETQAQEWNALQQQLVAFGRRSGLFQNIDVKNLGHSMGAPFQLKVKVRGPTSNIMDVGYGVSQVLPILIHILTDPYSGPRAMGLSKMAYYLLQQPEVHLHPRAQAELSSLLGQLASRGNQSFIVETHSDYFIDRARIEIMRGNICKDDVSLIYFEPKKNVVNVHNICFDDMGNMIGVPPKFRSFFLKESSRLMGFEDE